jgi:hypothetical protein
VMMIIFRIGGTTRMPPSRIFCKPGCRTLRGA